MEVDELEIIELELKYCERCGALWLRRCGSDEIYCATCIPKMLDNPTIRKSGGMRQLSLSHDWGGVDGQQRATLAMEGGHA